MNINIYCQAQPQFQPQLQLNQMGPEQTLKLDSDPPTPLHPKLFFIVKTILYWTYHTETWQGAIYYDPNKYYKAYEPIGHSLTDSLIDWLTHLLS